VREAYSAGCRIAYDVDGPADAPPLLLCHALSASADMWRPQVAPLGRRFRVLRPDMRGHGRSAVPRGEYTIGELGADALSVLDAEGIAKADVCGLSIGGLIVMWLAIHAPARVGRLVPVCTAPRITEPRLWTERIAQVRAGGLEAIAEVSMTRWFTERYRQAHPDDVARHRAMVAGCDHDGYVGACAVLRDTDLSAELPRVAAPTLVMSGVFDPVTPPSAGRAICDRVPGARQVTFDGAHLPNVEQAEAFNAALLEFLGAQ